jgi:hypothetical protein
MEKFIKLIQRFYLSTLRNKCTLEGEFIEKNGKTILRIQVRRNPKFKQKN